MTTLMQEPPNGTPTVNYDVTPEMIAQLKADYAALTADTPEGYQAVSLALKQVSGTRIAIEKKRKQLKEESLAWGRTVDAEAKRLTAIVLEIETPLREKKDAIDNERQRKLDALKADEDRRLAEAEQRRRDEEEAKIKAQREAEAAANRAEAEKLAKERAEHEAARKLQHEQYLAERAKIDADRAELQRQQQAAEAEQRRLAKIEKDRVDAELAKAAAERAATLKAEMEQQERERLERLKPDAEKLHAWADRLMAFVAETQPKLSTEDGETAFSNAVQTIEEVAECLRVWGSA